MTLAEWLVKRFTGFNQKFLALTFNMDYQELLAIISGDGLPSFRFVIQVTYFLGLSVEEQLELFYLVGETLGMSANAVYQAVAEEVLLMASENYPRIRQ